MLKHRRVKNKPKAAASGASTITKKLTFNNSQFQELTRSFQEQDIYPLGASLFTKDSISNALIEENLSKQHNVRIRKFPGVNVDDLNHHVHPVLHEKPKHIIIHIGINDATCSTSWEI